MTSPNPWTVERVEEWLIAQNGLTYEPTAIQIIRFLLDSLTRARQDAFDEAIAIAKVREAKFDGADSVVIELEAARDKGE